MAKKRTLFECQACGFQSPKWLGKCTGCNQWDTMIELTTEQIKFVEETKKNITESLEVMEQVEAEEERRKQKELLGNKEGPRKSVTSNDTSFVN